MTTASRVIIVSVEALWLVAGSSGVAVVVEKAVFSEEINQEARAE